VPDGEIRIVRYVLRGNYWVSPGWPSVPAPPFTVPPPDPPASTAFLVDDTASKLDGTKVLV